MEERPTKRLKTTEPEQAGESMEDLTDEIQHNKRFKLLLGELSAEHGTLNNLQGLLSCMKTLRYSEGHEQFKELGKGVFWNLVEISNPMYIPTIVNIMELLILDQRTCQYIWNSLMETLRATYTDGRKVFPLPPIMCMEILCLCAERGVQLTDKELNVILSWTANIAAREELIPSYLKTLISLQRNKYFTCDLDFLGEMYIIPKDIIHLAGTLSHSIYRIYENVINSDSLIHYFLFISHEQEIQLQYEKSFLATSLRKNWLNRNLLHQAVIFVDNEYRLNTLPKELIEKHLNSRDIHGCTPLHLAHLHGNTRGVKFLLSNGAKPGITDYYQREPLDMQSYVREIENTDAKFFLTCQGVIEAGSEALSQLEATVIMSENDAQTISEQLIELFKRIVKETEFADAEVVLCGSMRERLKCGALDEFDLQLQFKGHCDCSGKQITIAGVERDYKDFKRELESSLVKGLATVSLDGISLVPIHTRDPWKVIWLQGRAYGGLISVDVVPIIVGENNAWRELHRHQGEIVEGAPGHKEMKFAILDTWKNDTMRPFDQTRCEYEWDILDSIPVPCRLAIVIVKSLVQVYHHSKGGKKRHVKMPITPYMVKTALFYILASRSSHQLVLSKSHTYSRKRANALGDALRTVNRARRVTSDDDDDDDGGRKETSDDDDGGRRETSDDCDDGGGIETRDDCDDDRGRRETSDDCNDDRGRKETSNYDEGGRRETSNDCDDDGRRRQTSDDYDNNRGTTRQAKLQFNPDPKWITRSDLHTFWDEARNISLDIFTLIQCLAENGWKTRSYWSREYPIVPIVDIEYDKRSYGEKEYIQNVCSSCAFALGKLDGCRFL